MDPFFDPNSTRAVTQKMFPTKQGDGVRRRSGDFLVQLPPQFLRPALQHQQRGRPDHHGLHRHGGLGAGYAMLEVTADIERPLPVSRRWKTSLPRRPADAAWPNRDRQDRHVPSPPARPRPVRSQAPLLELRLSHASPADNLRSAATLARLFKAIHDSPVPTIAKIQGDALSAGLGLVAACDIAIANDHARFRTREVRVGSAGADEPLWCRRSDPGWRNTCS